MFPDDVGRCDREQSCGYHRTPKDFFADNPQSRPTHSDWSTPSTCRAAQTEPPKPTSFIAAETVSQTLHGYDRNNLFLFLRSKFGDVDAMRMMTDYRVGTSRHWPGACVFWQTDIDGRTRTGKVMLYDADSGKRVKHPFNHVSWVHSLLKISAFNLRQCFFGEHLLPLLRQLGIEANIFNFMDDVAPDSDVTAGYDIADYLLQIEPDQAVLQTMIRKNPMLQPLIDELQLELVSVGRYAPDTDMPLFHPQTLM